MWQWSKRTPEFAEIPKRLFPIDIRKKSDIMTADKKRDRT